MGVVMRVMNDKVLVEEDRVKDGDKFHSDQVLVFRQSFAALDVYRNDGLHFVYIPLLVRGSE